MMFRVSFTEKNGEHVENALYTLSVLQTLISMVEEWGIIDLTVKSVKWVEQETK